MTFAQWQLFAQQVDARAKRINDMRTDRAFKIAAAAGIDPNCVCIHNAAIDENLNGWCFRNPARLKQAKRANRILNDWTASRIAERIISRAWAQVERTKTKRQAS